MGSTALRQFVIDFFGFSSPNVNDSLERFQRAGGIYVLQESWQRRSQRGRLRPERVFPNLEHGPVAPDLRQRFSLSYLYELPVRHGRRFLGDAHGFQDAFLRGWQVAGITSAQTGEAVNAVMSTDLSNTGSFSYRPNQVANPYDFSFNTASQSTDFACSNPGHQTFDCLYNQAAFVAPALASGQQSAHSFGNAKIGDLRGPHLVDFDMVLQKNFKIRESQQIEFRSEFFNLFNHPNFGLSSGGSSSPVDVPGGAAITSTATEIKPELIVRESTAPPPLLGG